MIGQPWIGRLLGLPDLARIEHLRLSFGAAWAQAAPWAVWLGTAGLFVLGLVFYLRWQTLRRSRVRVWLAVGRAALLCLVFMFLAEPTLDAEYVSHPKPNLWLLFDGTDSMAIEDNLAPERAAELRAAVGLATPAAGDESAPRLSRIAYVRALLNESSHDLIPRLDQRFRLRAFQFRRSDGVSALRLSDRDGEPAEADTLAEQLTTEGQVSALGTALVDLKRRDVTGKPVGVVVVSDFDKNAGDDPVKAALGLGVPLYCVGVGPDAAVDVAIDLQAPPLMKKGERSTLGVTLRQTGLERGQLVVKLRARRLGGSDPNAVAVDVAEKAVAVTGEPVMAVEFPYTPEETGRFTFTAEVVPVPGEALDQNNAAEREVNIRDDFLRITYVEYEPSWEWRFVKEVFHRDQLVGMRGFRTFLRSADPKVRQTNELFLSTMTPQRSEFFLNDVLFLGDLPASALSTRFCEMLREFVGEFGGGLVIVSGPNFGPGQFEGTPLADMLPVIVDPDARVRDAQEFAPRLTPRASQVDFMQLGGGPAENLRAWNNLGRLPWYQPVARVHPQAEVLLEHPTDRCIDGKTPQPLIALKRYGKAKGEVVYLAFNETWRLRRQYGEQYYRQFWGQMIHRLALRHALGGEKRFVVTTDRQQYVADERVILTVEAYDENFEPLDETKLPDRKLTAELMLPEGPGARGPAPSSAHPLTREDHRQALVIPQLRKGQFETQIPVLQPGEHRVRVKDPVTGEFTEIQFQVTSLSAERRSAVRNVKLQDELRVASGGKSYDLTDVARLPDEIKADELTESAHESLPLWNTWLGFGLVVALMLGEWLTRKLVNLP